MQPRGGGCGSQALLPPAQPSPPEPGLAGATRPADTLQVPVLIFLDMQTEREGMRKESSTSPQIHTLSAPLLHYFHLLDHPQLTPFSV